MSCFPGGAIDLEHRFAIFTVVNLVGVFLLFMYVWFSVLAIALRVFSIQWLFYWCALAHELTQNDVFFIFAAGQVKCFGLN